MFKKTILILLIFITLSGCTQLFISDIYYENEQGEEIHGFYYWKMGIKDGEFYHERVSENIPCSDARLEKEFRECEL